MGQEGEVIRAERKMEAILCVRIFTYLIVGFLDKAVMVCMVLQGKKQKGGLRSCIASSSVNLRLAWENRVTTEVLNILQTLNFHCFFFSRCPGWP